MAVGLGAAHPSFTSWGLHNVIRESSVTLGHRHPLFCVHMEQAQTHCQRLSPKCTSTLPAKL